MSDELGALWDKTKARPGYIANFLVQTTIFLETLHIMSTAFDTYPSSVPVVMIYGLFGVMSVNKLSPVLGRFAQEFVDTLADVYWQTRKPENQIEVNQQ